MISVVVCTYNPRPDYLKRSLQSLSSQSLEKSDWELVVVDNNSSVQLDTWLDLSWHPSGRLVREEQRGLIPARVRGIRETSAELIVFVDDDNVLHPDYLLRASKIAEENPHLGCFGAAVIEPEFEAEVSKALLRYAFCLGLRSQDEDRWGNSMDDHSSLPWGAGLCTRRVIADDFAQRVKESEALASLGRRGTAVLSGDDLIFSFEATQRGLGKGVFQALRIVHLMPASRTTRKNLLDTLCGHLRSAVTLDLVYRDGAQASKHSSFKTLYKGLLKQLRRGRLLQLDFVVKPWSHARQAVEDHQKLARPVESIAVESDRIAKVG